MHNFKKLQCVMLAKNVIFLQDSNLWQSGHATLPRLYELQQSKQTYVIWANVEAPLNSGLEYLFALLSSKKQLYNLTQLVSDGSRLLIKEKARNMNSSGPLYLQNHPRQCESTCHTSRVCFTHPGG